jgi:hypothetical protein
VQSSVEQHITATHFSSGAVERKATHKKKSTADKKEKKSTAEVWPIGYRHQP